MTTLTLIKAGFRKHSLAGCDCDWLLMKFAHITCINDVVFPLVEFQSMLNPFGFDPFPLANIIQIMYQHSRVTAPAPWAIKDHLCLPIDQNPVT